MASAMTIHYKADHNRFEIMESGHFPSLRLNGFRGRY